MFVDYSHICHEVDDLLLKSLAFFSNINSSFAYRDFKACQNTTKFTAKVQVYSRRGQFWKEGRE
jgi:hypothetical protein